MPYNLSMCRINYFNLHQFAAWYSTPLALNFQETNGAISLSFERFFSRME